MCDLNKDFTEKISFDEWAKELKKDKRKIDAKVKKEVAKLEKQWAHISGGKKYVTKDDL